MICILYKTVRWVFCNALIFHPLMLLPRICLCAGLLRRNWYRQRPTQKCLWLGLFIDEAWEEAHFSHCRSLVREGNKYWISLHERRRIEIWIGVANACQCYWLFRIWRMKCIFCVYVCVSVWLMQTVPALNGFPPFLFSNNNLRAGVTQMKWMF